MNFLSHLQLSYPKLPEMVGNFIGDYVKGRKYLDYPTEISIGIKLHRQIDFFTDQHPDHKACRQFFKADYGLYSGVIVDMLFDHFLAKNWDKYTPLPLDQFAQLSYKTLYEHHDILPARVQHFLPKMKEAKRLESYADLSGIEESLRLMSHYTSLPDMTDSAMQIIDTEFVTLEHLFLNFYPQLIAEVQG